MGWWQGRKAVVTGGAGFIGSNLVQRLLELGARVRVVDSMARAQGSPSPVERWKGEVEFARLDLRDPAACREACTGQEFVFHLAARAGSDAYYREHSGRVFTENLLLDTNLLEAALERGVGGYFYASSSMVYPLERQLSPDAPSLKEEDAWPANPPNSYGLGKLVGERGVEHAAGENEQFRAAILRLANPYGPGQDIDLERGSVVPVLVRRALEYPHTSFRLRGTGRETRSYCYITDVVEAMVRSVEALERQQLVGPVNVSGDGRLRILSLAQEVIRQSGKDIPLELVPAPTRIWSQVVNCSRAHEELQWAPRIDVSEGIRRTFAYVESKLDRQRTAH